VTRTRCLLLLFVLCTAVPVCLRAAPAPRPAVAITGVSVVDVRRGRRSGPRTVVIEDGRIVAIDSARGAKIPDGAQRVDGRGRFLIPGLADMHVHLFNLVSRRPPNDWMFPLYVANGVTSVREMNADAGAIAQVARWRTQFDAGELVAPRIVAAGIAVRGDSPTDAAHQVDAAAAAGAEFIKVFSEIPAANWRAALDAARRHWLPVAGHAPAAVALADTASAGHPSNEHLMQAYEACSSIQTELLDARHGLAGDALLALRDAQEARALAAFDDSACRRVSRALAAAGQAQVPTLVLADEDSLRSETAENDPRWHYLREDERARWRRLIAGYSEHDAELAKLRWPVARRIVSIMHKAGVRIMTGTDAPMPGVYPGFSVHEEMALLVAAGFTPLEALRAATFAPAEFLGIAGVAGSAEVGMRADLVLLDADPTRDIANTRRINAVVIDGRLLRRDALDALLANDARKGESGS
jgi:imidazolonepropionase-like amidohydrolase